MLSESDLRVAQLSMEILVHALAGLGWTLLCAHTLRSLSTVLAHGDVSDQGAHTMVLGSLTAELAVTRHFVIFVIVGIVVLLVVGVGAEKEVEDRILNRRFVGAVRDPVVVQEVLFQVG